ncbi:glycoside hydrolase [Membranicola marinus]|uniref:Glycoside hydrolase n=1 Tax=Membranihabitans marinus TaxID=1227546 RepID=A0A953LBR3_9BACT|nr:sialidase family protein [Membranihabitans marinus]MBY5956939.1 glycoside hydrolase [Membranihabitans marinus]
MKRKVLESSRRNFVKGVSTLIVTSKFGLNQFRINKLFSPMTHDGLKVIDKEVVFVGDQVDGFYRPVSSEFIFSQFPEIPEVPESIPVHFPWKVETSATFPERSLNGFGALNEGIYSEGPNILQIIATTPGKPDTKGGSPSYKNWYRVSNDSGKTFSDFRLIVLEGNSENNPIDGVEIGRNGYTIPFTSVIFRSHQGELMVPIHLHPWDEKKKEIYNPANAYLFGDSGVLIGKWAPDFKDVAWKFGNWLRIDHQLSTRGLFEPSVAELKTDGRFAMVMRGSNHTQADLPGYTWLSFSNDQCRTWSDPVPFTYSNGKNFYTPASCSTLFRSEKTGTLYWIGNVLPENSNGNNPRNPLVIGRVDEHNFGLIKESIVGIDFRHKESESENVELSNYKIMEHADLDEILIALTRREKGKWAQAPSWYRIELS